MANDPRRAVTGAVRAVTRTVDVPLVLAVSGGLDSMVLMHAMAEAARARVLVVATFDHGTGEHATASTAHVARWAAMLGLPVVVGRATGQARPGDGLEAAWRRERYEFLHSVARAGDARIVTAHSEDDQVETVLMRVLRGSGARGLAGLYAPSRVLRPLLGVRRSVIRKFAQMRGIDWRDDPTNDSRRFLRNRIRLDILPALRQARPGIETELLALARRAAAWRREMDQLVEQAIRPARDARGALRIVARELAGHDRDSLCVIWGTIAARVGLALDRRGTQRLAAFTSTEPRTGSVPLSGGWYVEARRGVYILGKRSQAAGAPVALPEAGELRWGEFRFRVEPAVAGGEGTNLDDHSWRAALSGAGPVVVRTWSAGDRLRPSGGHAERRVKRYLSDAGVRGLDRLGWPVVVEGEGDVVWIPGVRRADAATDRSGRPVRHYVCERISR